MAMWEPTTKAPVREGWSRAGPAGNPNPDTVEPEADKKLNDKDAHLPVPSTAEATRF